MEVGWVSMTRRAAALALAIQCRLAALPEPNEEYRFAPPRRWRFDYAWPKLEPPVALEVEGGVFVAGRHSRGAGMLADMEKYNTATLAGWKVLRVTPTQIADGSALTLIEHAIRGEVTT
jgi:hypothetical protein